MSGQEYFTTTSQTSHYVDPNLQYLPTDQYAVNTQQFVTPYYCDNTTYYMPHPHFPPDNPPNQQFTQFVEIEQPPMRGQAHHRPRGRGGWNSQRRPPRGHFRGGRGQKGHQRGNYHHGSHSNRQDYVNEQSQNIDRKAGSKEGTRNMNNTNGDCSQTSNQLNNADATTSSRDVQNSYKGGSSYSQSRDKITSRTKSRGYRENTNDSNHREKTEVMHEGDFSYQNDHQRTAHYSAKPRYPPHAHTRQSDNYGANDQYHNTSFRARRGGRQLNHHRQAYQRNSEQASKYSSRKDDKTDKDGVVAGVADNVQNMNMHASGQFSQKRNQGNTTKRKFGPSVKKSDDDESQRDTLIEQLTNNSYECMVCCELIYCEAAVWSCSNCHHVFHLRCIKRWARTATATVEDTEGWRCPACQNVCSRQPNQYRCFCGKVRDPVWNRYETPHSCGEVCGKKRGGICFHSCNVLCHPGPCPPCHAMVTKSCDCGRIKKSIPCNQAGKLKCGMVCDKTLNCGLHKCSQQCHAGPCNDCEETVKQVCYCSEESRSVICGTTEAQEKSYSCNNPCAKTLPCGNHKCPDVCHVAPCDPCRLLPESVTHCQCGQSRLSEITPAVPERSSCLDPVATCGKQCGKQLKCGTPENPHFCKMLCHEGSCGSCDQVTEVTCRCGFLSEEMPCVQAEKYTPENPFTCDKRCNKKKSCGRHKCSQLCCVDDTHSCDLTCGRKLSCGLHRCDEPCHRGNCHQCWQVSFDELTCHCGAQILYPPIACGTRPPECNNVCTRHHPCGHQVRHSCHSDENCPPCTELTEKWCMGKHEKRKNIPCHLTEVSCGMRCGRRIPCQQHTCKRVCHKGDCVTEEDVCTQRCNKPRQECGHPCGAQCHGDKECPRISCKAQISVRCKCGHREEKVNCLTGGQDSMVQDFQRITNNAIAMKLKDIQLGQSVDIGDLTRNTVTKKPRQLDCNEECGIIERNRRVALALEIKNPDLTGKLGTPQYNQFLKDYTRQNLTYVSGVEKELSELVQTAQRSKQMKRSHAFPPMKRDERRVIHELAEYYGCETQSYDEEPKKNVVATAYRGKCWLPSVTLTTAIQRELHPKAPTPIPLNAREETLRWAAKAAKQSTALIGSRPITPSGPKESKPAFSWASRAAEPKPAEPVAAKATEEKEFIDYFEMTG